MAVGFRWFTALDYDLLKRLSTRQLALFSSKHTTPFEVNNAMRFFEEMLRVFSSPTFLLKLPNNILEMNWLIDYPRSAMQQWDEHPAMGDPVGFLEQAQQPQKGRACRMLTKPRQRANRNRRIDSVGAAHRPLCASQRRIPSAVRYLRDSLP
ncbi:hypothetical protein VTN96DRAFT_4379 [Rasamsonia emersonii]